MLFVGLGFVLWISRLWAWHIWGSLRWVSVVEVLCILLLMASIFILEVEPCNTVISIARVCSAYFRWAETLNRGFGSLHRFGYFCHSLSEMRYLSNFTVMHLSVVIEDCCYTLIAVIDLQWWSDVKTLDSWSTGPGFRSHPRHCRVRPWASH